MFKCLADVYERLQNNILILCSAEPFMRLIGWRLNFYLPRACSFLKDFQV